jgi:DNA-binding MarR family transcriptional regulator
MNLTELAQLSRKLRKVMLIASSQNNEPVSSGQVTIFEDVYKHSPTTVQDITERTNLAQSYVSKIISHMKKRDVVKLQKSKKDKRKTIITFNPELADFVQSMSKRPIRKALQQVLSNSKDITEAETLLERLTELFVEGKSPVK